MTGNRVHLDSSPLDINFH